MPTDSLFLFRQNNQHEAIVIPYASFNSNTMKVVNVVDGVTMLIGVQNGMAGLDKETATQEKYDIAAFRFDSAKFNSESARVWLANQSVDFSDFIEADFQVQPEGDLENKPSNIMDNIDELVIRFKSAISKPFPNQHAARVRNPDDFLRLRTINITDGITAIVGPLKSKPDGGTEIQSYRFDRKKFTPEEARSWLKEHKISASLEVATGKGMKKEILTRLEIAIEHLNHIVASYRGSHQRKPKENKTADETQYEDDEDEKLEKEKKSPQVFSMKIGKSKDQNSFVIFTCKDNGICLLSAVGRIFTNDIAKIKDGKSIVEKFTNEWAIYPHGIDKIDIDFTNGIEEEEIDSGEIDVGVIDLDGGFAEIFAKGNKFNGRFIFQKKGNEIKFSKSRSGLPYVLSPSALKDKNIIEKLNGRSGLPSELEEIVPLEFRYWKFDIEDANELRKNLNLKWLADGTIKRALDGVYSLKSKSKEIDKFVPFKKIGNFEQRLVYGIVYEPDEVDSQGDSASAEEIERAAHSFAKNGWLVGQMHMEKAEDVTVVESFIAPVNFSYEGSSDVIKKGSWVMVSHVENDEIAQKIEDEEYTGYSMAGLAVEEEE